MKFFFPGSTYIFIKQTTESDRFSLNSAEERTETATSQIVPLAKMCQNVNISKLMLMLFELVELFKGTLYH